MKLTHIDILIFIINAIQFFVREIFMSFKADNHITCIMLYFIFHLKSSIWMAWRLTLLGSNVIPIFYGR